MLIEGKRWHYLDQQLYCLATKLTGEIGCAGDIAAGPRQARNETGRYRIGDSDHDNRDRSSRPLGGAPRPGVAQATITSDPS